MLTHKDKHASGDTISEGYLQTTHKRSTLVVEGHACIKEERERLFYAARRWLPRQIYVIEITAPIPAA